MKSFQGCSRGIEKRVVIFFLLVLVFFFVYRRLIYRAFRAQKSFLKRAGCINERSVSSAGLATTFLLSPAENLPLFGPFTVTTLSLMWCGGSKLATVSTFGPGPGAPVC